MSAIHPFENQLESLTAVVRQDQANPDFAITDWSVQPLSQRGLVNPDGLWLLTGRGYDERAERPWSVVVKDLTRPSEQSPPDSLWYWEREVRLVQSGLLERLPGPVRAPRFYRADETPTGARLWMEYIDEAKAAWGLRHYAFAAHQLGRWNGACLHAEQPAFPWLARDHYRTWLRWLDPNREFQFPLNQTHILPRARARYERLWAERDMFFGVLDRLPRSFAHLDSQRRNLIIRPGANHRDELVMVDWAVCGLAPLGAELAGLVGWSALLLEWPPAALRRLDTVAFNQYRQGLRASGWSGRSEDVRLGFLAWLVTAIGCSFPGYTAWWCSTQHRASALRSFGLAEEALMHRLVPVLEFVLDRGDEARRLLGKSRL